MSRQSLSLEVVSLKMESVVDKEENPKSPKIRRT